MATDTEQLILSISADVSQVKRALDRLGGDAKKAGDTVKNAFGGNASKSMQAVQADAKNLSFQIADIATGLSTGQSPFIIMNQQIGQIMPLLGGQGLGGALALLKSALATSWPMLALMGISALASATIAYFSDTEEGAKKAADEVAKAVEKQLEAVNNLRKAQGLGPLDRGVNAIDEMVAMRQATKDNIDIQKQLKDQIEATSDTINGLPADAFEGQTHTVQQLLAAMRLLPTDLEAAVKILEDVESRSTLPEAVKAAVTAMIDLAMRAMQTKRNLDDLKATQDGVARATEQMKKATEKFNETLGKMGGIAKAQTNDLQELLDLYRKAVQEARTMGQVMAANEAFLTGAERVFSSGTSGDVIKKEEGFRANAYWDMNHYRVGFGSDKYVDAMGEVQDVTKDTVVTLEQANKDLARRIGEFQNTIRSQIGSDMWAAMAEEQKAALTSIAYNYGHLPPMIVAALKAGDQGKVATAIANLSSNPERRKREAALFAGGSFAAGDALKAAEDTEKAQKALADYLVTLDEQATLQQRINEINKSGLSAEDKVRAITVETEVQKALNKAKQDGVTLDAQYIAQIREKALAVAETDITATQIKDAAKEQAEALKAAGKAAEDFQKATQAAVSGLIKDLIDGKDAAEAFSDALGKIADKAIDMAINSLFSAGGPGAKGGMLGGMIIPGILHGGGVAGKDGYGHGRMVSASAFAGARRMHRGGIAGNEVPTILQRGEIVLPRGARPGGSGSVHRIVLQDDSGRMAEVADQRIRTASGDIIQISTQASVRTVKNNFSKMALDSERRQR